MNKLYFREEQRYTQSWVWLLLLGSCAISVIPLWYGVYHQVSTGSSWGTSPITTDKLVVVSSIVTIFMAVIVWLFAVQRLETEITPEGGSYRYLPFIRKWRVISPEQIRSFSVGTYSPLGTYGGWGIRNGGSKTGKAYTISGNLGLTLFLADGTRILLGTRRKDALLHAMEKIVIRQNL
jgi:hypothetical protein